MIPEQLIAFEKEVADLFNAGKIRYPVHLSGGNELLLIKIFEDFRRGDWVFSSWRNHYHALLTGIPPEEVRRQIMGGHSMTICSAHHHFFSSAIVAGCCPIALGVAWQIKRRGGKERAWLFLGEMTAQTGIAMECYNYAKEHDLPLIFVVEDNGKSVCTPTKDVWPEYRGIKPDYHYQWELPWPHAGAGVRVQF